MAKVKILGSVPKKWFQLRPKAAIYFFFLIPISFPYMSPFLRNFISIVYDFY